MTSKLKALGGCSSHHLQGVVQTAVPIHAAMADHKVQQNAKVQTGSSLGVYELFEGQPTFEFEEHKITRKHTDFSLFTDI